MVNDKVNDGAEGNVMGLTESKKELLGLFLRRGVIGFGDYLTRAGRRSPLFFELGKLYEGRVFHRVVEIMVDVVAAETDLVVGSVYALAYKSIPLGAGVGVRLALRQDRDVNFFHNRKEAKEYGEGGELVGYDPDAGVKNVIMVDDVLASGLSIKNNVALLDRYDIQPERIFVALDKQERGEGMRSAKVELEERYGIKVISALTLDEVIDSVYHQKLFGSGWIDDECYARIVAYREKYGA